MNNKNKTNKISLPFLIKPPLAILITYDSAEIIFEVSTNDIITNPNDIKLRYSDDPKKFDPQHEVGATGNFTPNPIVDDGLFCKPQNLKQLTTYYVQVGYYDPSAPLNFINLYNQYNLPAFKTNQKL